MTVYEREPDDVPRLLRDAEVRQRRRAMLRDPHIASLLLLTQPGQMSIYWTAPDNSTCAAEIPTR